MIRATASFRQNVESAVIFIEQSGMIGRDFGPLGWGLGLEAREKK